MLQIERDMLYYEEKQTNSQLGFNQDIAHKPTIFVTNFGKIDHLRVFCISRNTNLKYLMYCASPVAQYSHARYLV